MVQDIKSYSLNLPHVIEVLEQKKGEIVKSGLKSKHEHASAFDF